MYKKILLPAIALFMSFQAFAEDVKVETLSPPALFSVCQTCHGMDGISTMAGYPSLAGQDKAYIISSIKAYKNGERNGGLSVLMKPMSQMFTTDESIEEMATYLNSLKR